MRLLAFDTATLLATSAVTDNETVLARRQRQVTTHSEGLLALIDETLRAAETGIAELDAIVCGRGPGSFTGLRIGLATAKGLCLAADKPLLCVSSLVGCAGAVAGAGHEGPVAVLLDARRDQVYCGLFDRLRLLEPEVLLEPAELRRHLGTRPSLVVAGDGALRYHAEHFSDLPLAADACHAIEAEHLAFAARARAAAGDFDDLERVVPTYLRPPDVRAPR